MISHKYKCIFIHIPKTAGTSIEAALGHLDGHEGRGGQDHRTIRMIEKPFLRPNIFKTKENICQIGHRLLYQLGSKSNPNSKKQVTKAQYRNYFKFTIVRNPWARVFSWYKNVMRDHHHMESLNINKKLTLEGFISTFIGKGKLRSQLFWLKDFESKIPLEFIGRFENLSKDFNEVCEIIGVEGISLPHKIKSSKKDYRDYYNQKTKDIVSEYYKEEINLFGYKFDS